MNQILNIVKFTEKFWKLYLAVSFLVILTSLLGLVGPFLNKNIVDIITERLTTGNSDKVNALVILLILTILSDVAVTLFTNIGGYLGDLLGAKLNTFLTSKFYKHILDLEVEYFDNEISGSIMNKLERGIQNIATFINQMFNNFLPFFLTAFLTIFVLMFYSWEIALLLAILFPIYVIISDKSSKAWMGKQGEINKIQDKISGRIFESISGIRVVKSFLRGNLEHQFYLKNRTNSEAIVKKQSLEWHQFDVYRRLVLNIILFVIYAYIVYRTYIGVYTIAEMVLLIQLVTQARFPLFAMSFILGQIQQAQAGSKDFFDVLNRSTKIQDKENAKDLGDVKGKIEYKDVTFKYTNGKNVLDKISFDLNIGQKLAIVGESGEGKSTLTNLLLHFYEPQSGGILIDGQNIQDVTLESLHKNISVVLQESLLFSGTIAENIKYGNPEASDEEMISAAKAANAFDFVSKLENGFDSEIGERGVKLSGGQKQRISIARAILKNSPILILDEATSSLDSKAEIEVQEALDNLMKGKTTIIIAHRLSTIRSVDKIIVIKGGKIAEQGSPSELLKSDGIYAGLVKLQSSMNSSKEEVHEALKEFELK